ncbi:MGMT family protein [Patescibacteria group bacterium]|nr:MGMT family protein [Patescibacteria group bacterium]
MNFYQKVYSLVKKIPKGKVATYGQIASIISTPRAARMVGWALHVGAEENKAPWQRVINSKGMISTTCLDHPKDLQAYLLKKEGVEVKKTENNYFIQLDKYLWRPKKAKK